VAITAAFVSIARREHAHARGNVTIRRVDIPRLVNGRRDELTPCSSRRLDPFHEIPSIRGFRRSCVVAVVVVVVVVVVVDGDGNVEVGATFDGTSPTTC
jgi:hypothetical protein